MGKSQYFYSEKKPVRKIQTLEEQKKKEANAKNLAALYFFFSGQVDKQSISTCFSSPADL